MACTLKSVAQKREVEIEIQALEGSRPFKQRLGCFGVLPGARMTVLDKLPFGGPVQIRIGQTQIALRSRDAERIYVSEVNPS